MSLWKLINARWGSGDGEIDEVRMDASTNSLQVIQYEHHEIHSGSSFTVHIDNITANTDDHRTLLGFETPAGTEHAHLIVYASSSHPAEVFLYEGVTIDDDEGTELTIEDRNRTTDNTSSQLSFQNPAVAGLATWMLEAEIAAANFATTTTLDHFQLAAGDGPKALGGTTRGTEEWVLAPSTKYAVVVQNIGANANTHEIHLDWYEHTDKH